MSVVIAAGRLTGAASALVAGLVAVLLAPVWRDRTVELPFLDAFDAQPVEAALLVPVAVAVVFGAAYRLELVHLVETSARRLVAVRLSIVALVVVAAASPVLVVRGDLGAALVRNAIVGIAVVLLSGVVLTAGSAWMPLLAATLVMSIFGARPGGGYDGWAVLFQPSNDGFDVAVATAFMLAAGLVVLLDARLRLHRMLR